MNGFSCYVMIPFADMELAKEMLDKTGFFGTVVPTDKTLDMVYETNSRSES